MEKDADKHLSLENLRLGLPPGNPFALEAVTVTLRHDIAAFWASRYLEDFIAAGGSKVKFLLGHPGSGKTHALLLLQHKARQMNYIAVYIDARSVRLHQFNTIYQAVMEAVDIENLVMAYSAGLVKKLGYQAEAEDILPGPGTFFNLAVNSGRAEESLRRDINEQLEVLHQDRKIHHYLATAFTQLCADYLGSRPLECEQREHLVRWLKGQAIPAKDLRKLHIFSRIDKFNARYMLGSLAHLAGRCGYRGIYVAMDGLETLLEKDENGRSRYGRAARNEVYESLRQLVDDFVEFEGVFFVFAAQPEILHDEKAGFKSYEALWMRVQNEVAGSRVNLFADMVNQDVLVREYFDQAACMELRNKMDSYFGNRVENEIDPARELRAAGMVSPLRRVIAALAQARPGFTDTTDALRSGEDDGQVQRPANH
ncbi:MAG: ATP-binding protein [Actinobacteria bacterium]|nr:ATP-binding protein [Actinomycetota bacterium]